MGSSHILQYCPTNIYWRKFGNKDFHYSYKDFNSNSLSGARNDAGFRGKGWMGLGGGERNSKDREYLLLCL